VSVRVGARVGVRTSRRGSIRVRTPSRGVTSGVYFGMGVVSEELSPGGHLLSFGL